MRESTNVVVLLDIRLGPVIPAAALPALRAATAIYLGDDLPQELAGPLGAQAGSFPSDVLDAAKSSPVAVISGQLTEPLAAALHADGAKVISSPQRVGTALLDAVDVMDRKYSPGGCAWSGAQTHDSLRKYLLEECYELLEAIESGDQDQLRSELGDVLLQVLYHARIAADHDTNPFDIDTVANGMVTKQVARSPHVFGNGERGLDYDEVHRQWEELKKKEKDRQSAVAGVALGQPALALAAKLVSRARQAGIPSDLWPDADAPNPTLFTSVVAAEQAAIDPEFTLRSVARQFAADIDRAERAATQAGLDPHKLTATEWRKFWQAGQTT